MAQSLEPSRTFHACDCHVVQIGELKIFLLDGGCVKNIPIKVYKRSLYAGEYKKMSQARNWTFTLNNYSLEEMEKIDELSMQIGSDIKYIICGKETCPTTGTPHLQGYIQFSKRMRLGQVRNLISPRAHCEVARGTPLQNQIYCKKEDDYFEYGTCQTAIGMVDNVCVRIIFAQ